MLLSLALTFVLSASAVTAAATPATPPVYFRSYVAGNLKYLQAMAPGNTAGDAALGPVSSAGQFNIVSGQLVQVTPDGSTIYGQVGPLDPQTPGQLKLLWSSSPSTNATFSFDSYGTGGLVTTVKGVNQNQQIGFLLNCGDSNVVSDVYLNLNPYSAAPAGCATTTMYSFYDGEYGESLN
ncbi:hypothetical protein M422DRAFT_773824 [Sphaerobolus stellatus SS14]|nr:hypothetical protein M422DRAFT_773824 [Sphaerobolus stellatus SS14]